MRAIIIDDERLARAELRKLLQDFPEVEVVDEASRPLPFPIPASRYTLRDTYIRVPLRLRSQAPGLTRP